MHPNLLRLSHSAQQLLETCPRLYELDRLAPRLSLDGTNIHLDFGSLVGSMIQDFLVGHSTGDAIWKAFLSYPRELFQSDIEEEKEERRTKKDFFFAMAALDKFRSFREEELSPYDVVYFQGKPAIELGFSIDCGGGFFYRGKLDALLKNSRSGELATLECKTTGSRYLHEAMFRNSGQGIGYSAIVDAISKELGVEQRDSFPLIYPVYQSTTMAWTKFPFVKSRNSHANWLRHLLRSIQHISEYAEDSYFPMYGQNCFHWNRPCRFFESCEMSNKFLVGEKPAVKEDKEGEYPFTFSLDELIEAQLSKQEQ